MSTRKLNNKSVVELREIKEKTRCFLFQNFQINQKININKP